MKLISLVDIGVLTICIGCAAPATKRQRNGIAELESNRDLQQRDNDIALSVRTSATTYFCRPSIDPLPVQTSIP